MAVTEITPTALVKGTTEGVVTQGAGTAINTANTMEILYPKEGKLLLWVDSDHASTAAVISAGDAGVAKGLGATTWAVGNTVAEIFLPDSDRHLIATGDGASAFKGCIEISWATDSAGFLRAFYLP